MVRIKVKLGSKGQVVIPKIIRDSVGLAENEPAIMEVRDGVVEIKPIKDTDIIKKWEERARKDKVNVSKWIYGDKLYESEFQ